MWALLLTQVIYWSLCSHQVQPWVLSRWTFGTVELAHGFGVPEARPYLVAQLIVGWCGGRCTRITRGLQFFEKLTYCSNFGSLLYTVLTSLEITHWNLLHQPKYKKLESTYFKNIQVHQCKTSYKWTYYLEYDRYALERKIDHHP